MATAPPDVHYADSGGISIAYTVFGDGPIDIVYTAGFISHQELQWEIEPFRQILSRLGECGRVVAYDKRGTGLSERTLGFGSAAERMGDLEAVMDAAALDRASLVGISEGGPLSCLLAATHPERVEHLVLYGTFARLLPGDGLDVDLPVDPDTYLDMLVREWGSGTMLAPLLGFPPDQELLARYERNCATPRVAAEVMRANGRIDVRDALAAVSAPTLVLHQAGDPMIDPEHGRYLASHIPGARHEELGGEFHLSWRPEEMAPALGRIAEFLGSDADARRADRVLATVLFTDLVGSTERAAEAGDARWRALLDAHDAAAQRTVERHGGKVVKSTGDGILATFSTPARAIDCATDLNREIKRIGLDSRAGVHTGEIELRERDVAGIGVHLAARIMGEAGDGEVFVSRTVRDLMTGSAVEFVDRGEHTMKGIDEPWQLYSVRS